MTRVNDKKITKKPGLIASVLTFSNKIERKQMLRFTRREARCRLVYDGSNVRGIFTGTKVILEAKDREMGVERMATISNW